MPVFQLAAIGAIALGALLLLGAVTVIVRRVNFARRATQLTGTVIRCERTTTHNDGWVYTPIVRYQGRDGRVIEHTPTVSTSTSNYAVGEQLAVFVDPQDPTRVMLGRPGSARVWFVPMVFALAGVVFAGIGSVLLVIAG